MDKSMDKIRNVPVLVGTKFEMSLVPKDVLRGTNRWTNRLNNRNVPRDKMRDRISPSLRRDI